MNVTVTDTVGTVNTLIVVDTETTGLNPASAGIVDFAAVVIRDGQIIGEYQTLVWPGRKNLTADHRAVMAQTSGITVEELLDTNAPTPYEAATRFHQWAVNYNAEWTSYNVQFDAKFLDDKPWHIWLRPHLCVMQAATQHLGPLGHLYEWPNPRNPQDRWKWPKLPEACELLGIPFEETHRALADARAAAQIAIQLKVGTNE